MAPAGDEDAAVLGGDQVITMERMHPAGFFVATSTNAREYRLRISLYSGESQELEDPYRFPPLLTSFELHLHGEGTNYESYRTLGAHPVTCEGVAGRALRRVGSERRSGQRHRRFQRLGSHAPSHAAARRRHLGNFSCPGSGEGAHYKYSVLSPSGDEQDQMRSLRLLRRGPAQDRVHRLGAYRTTPGPTRRGWNSAPQRNWLHEPVSIYEVHLESWMRGPANEWLTYRELADQLVDVCDATWATRIWN